MENYGEKLVVITNPLVPDVCVFLNRPQEQK